MALFEFKIEIAPASSGPVETVLIEGEWDLWSVMDDAVLRRSWLVGIFESENQAAEQWARLAPLLIAAGGEVVGKSVVRALGDADWRESYKAHFHAWRFDRLHWVPDWERGTYAVPPGDAVLWLDPGMAFGTGNHETTRLCVERLVAWVHARGTGGRVIDAGCGSGILALSAVVLGFQDVFGFDNDPEAIHVSEANAALNNLSGRVHFSVADLGSGLAGRQAEVVLANIQADVLMRHARELTMATAPGGILGLSGILAEENGRVREAFSTVVPGWSIDGRVMGEWSDLLLRRPA